MQFVADRISLTVIRLDFERIEINSLSVLTKLFVHMHFYLTKAYEFCV
jgi:hypothetical protein